MALWNTYLKWTPPSNSLCRNYSISIFKQGIQLKCLFEMVSSRKRHFYWNMSLSKDWLEQPAGGHWEMAPKKLSPCERWQWHVLISHHKELIQGEEEGPLRSTEPARRHDTRACQWHWGVLGVGVARPQFWAGIKPFFHGHWRRENPKQVSCNCYIWTSGGGR